MVSNTNYYAIFVLGKDTTGIVADITKALFELGANINDSSHTIIGNQFAMLLLISTKSSCKKKEIEEIFSSVEKNKNLTIHVHELKEEDIHRSTHAPSQLCVIHLYGADKPGIVYQVAHLLSVYKVNIIDLSTRRFGSDLNPIYIMYLEAEIPNDINTKELGNELNKLANDLNVEIKYELEEVANL